MEETKNNKSREDDLSSFLLYKTCDTLIRNMRQEQERLKKEVSHDQEKTYLMLVSILDSLHNINCNIFVRHRVVEECIDKVHDAMANLKLYL